MNARRSDDGDQIGESSSRVVDAIIVTAPPEADATPISS
jgi:hypothetical protein